jgi:4'-phosphopantetheinyl transferase
VILATAVIEIGIDVEVLRSVPRASAMARRFFSAAERDAVLLAEGGARDRAFLRIWTQKEAYLKATGLGVGMPLREVETEPDPAAPPRLVAVGGDRSEAARWAMTEIGIPGSICTLASLGVVAGIEARRIAANELGAGS